MTIVQTWLHKADLNWQIRLRGPGVPEVNGVARLAFRERNQHRTALFWQELVWTDSTALGPDHHCNQHNDGLWVEKGADKSDAQDRKSITLITIRVVT